uniref:Uncharacterized protein n=1 Tax=Romanomermis culicivorax TaxID=13658 RepID=A0A915IHE0_ROMCU
MNDASLSCTPLDQGENLSNTGVYGSTSRLSGSTSFLSSLGPVGFSMLTETTSSAQQSVSETLAHSSGSGGGLAPLAEAAAYLGEQLLHPYQNLMSTNFSQSSLRQ